MSRLKEVVKSGWHPEEKESVRNQVVRRQCTKSETVVHAHNMTRF